MADRWEQAAGSWRLAGCRRRSLKTEDRRPQSAGIRPDAGDEA
ncbi:hypothetical protein [uncultured Dialister sp.]|nr:hypothetical protein [uncultured Dialister sp.]